MRGNSGNIRHLMIHNIAVSYIGRLEVDLTAFHQILVHLQIKVSQLQILTRCWAILLGDSKG